MNDPLFDSHLLQNRRQFFGRSSTGIGVAALASLLNPDLFADQGAGDSARFGGLEAIPHFAPKAKRVIYLLQSGAPSQVDLFDPKPGLEKQAGRQLPDSVRGDQRITTMTSGQKTLPILPSQYPFRRHGRSGLSLSDRLPHLGKVADELCLVRSMHTEAINHDPAITFFQTGSQLAGRPSIGSWPSYGLG